MTGLSEWIAQSDSWRAYVNFHLDVGADHSFLSRITDYYVASLGKVFDILRSQDRQNRQKAFLQIAEGLEIFSLASTRHHFKGIDHRQNTLLIATLHYLAGYPSSSYLIAKWLDRHDTFTDAENFICSFLLRKRVADNLLTEVLFEYVDSGTPDIINRLQYLLENEKENALQSSPRDFIAYSLALALIENFRESNVWIALQDKIPSSRLETYLYELTHRTNPIWEYFPSQTLAIKSGLLDESETVSLQMPTSAGKTAVCELVIYDYLKSHPKNKAVFLVPYRALAAELRETLCRSLQRLKIRTKTLYGGSAPTLDEQLSIEETDLLIITPEKFLALEAVVPNLFQTFQLIVCDEGHLIDSGERGISYELLLTKLKSYQIPGRKFVFASAIIPNIQEVHQWLDGKETHLVCSDYRPAGIEFAFLQSDQVESSLIFNPTKSPPEKYIVRKFLTKNDFLLRESTQKPKYLPYKSIKTRAVAVALKALRLGTVAIFTTQKNHVLDLGAELLKQIDSLSLPKPDEGVARINLEHLMEYCASMLGKEYILCGLLERGVALHNGRLPQNLRDKLELYLREEWIKLVVCTNTLAEGVNLPIRTIVLHTIRRFQNGKLRYLLLRDIKNLVGRAGRAGYNLKGLVIAVAEKEYSHIKRVIENDITSPVEGPLYRVVAAIKSHLVTNELELSPQLFEEADESFLSLIDKIDSSLISLISEDEISDLETVALSLAKKTFAYHHSSDNDKEWVDKLFQVRGHVLMNLIGDKELQGIREAGVSPRLYAQLRKVITTIQLPETDTGFDTILNYFFQVADALPQFAWQLEDFNRRKKMALKSAHLKDVVKMWMTGKWYDEIAATQQLEIEDVLELFASFISFNLKLLFSTVIKALEHSHKGHVLIAAIRNWPEFLEYGISSEDQLELIRLGIHDRFALISLSRWLEQNHYTAREQDNLKAFLVLNRESVIRHLKSGTPTLTFNELERFFERET